MHWNMNIRFHVFLDCFSLSMTLFGGHKSPLDALSTWRNHESMQPFLFIGLSLGLPLMITVSLSLRRSPVGSMKCSMDTITRWYSLASQRWLDQHRNSLGLCIEDSAGDVEDFCFRVGPICDQ